MPQSLRTGSPPSASHPLAITPGGSGGSSLKQFISAITAACFYRSTTMQLPPHMIPPGVSRRAFLKTAFALAAGAPLLALLEARAREVKGPLMAYVGTFSSPLRDVLPTEGGSHP